MPNEPQELTPEQYKEQLLRRSFAEKVIEYEELVANLRTQLAMVQQELETGRQDLTVDTPK